MFVEFTKKQVDGSLVKICINTAHIIMFRHSYQGTYIELANRDDESINYIMVEEDYETVKRSVNA